MMALQMVGNKLTKEDIKLLKLEEKRRNLHDCIENDARSGRKQNQELFLKYRQVNKQIRNIAYNPTGIFDDARFGHLLDKNNKLNLKLLRNWRVRRMEDLNAEEMVEELKEILNEKEFLAFVKSHIEDKHYKEIANELDISTSYSYKVLNNAENKIEDNYDLEKVVKMLKEAENIEIEEEPEDDNPEPQEETEESPKEEDKSKGIFVNFDDETTEDDIEEITGLITRIQGVSHISENNPKIEELKKEVASILDNF